MTSKPSLSRRLHDLLTEAKANGEIASFSMNEHQHGEHVWDSRTKVFGKPVAYRRTGPVVISISADYPFDRLAEERRVAGEIERNVL